MKKLLIGLALLACGAAANAQTFCIDYVNFCDGMEITAGGGALSGVWQNTDCAGSTSPQDLVLPRDGQLITICQAAGVCDLAAQVGFDLLIWFFNIGGGTGTLIGISGGTPFPFQINTPIAVAGGACPFGPDAAGPAVPSLAR